MQSEVVPRPRFYSMSGIGLGVLLLVITTPGCIPGEADAGVDRVCISGHVVLNDQPLKAGAIVFHCIEKDGSDSGTIAYGYIEDGYYQIDADNGPSVGTARVEFWPKPLDRGSFEGELEEARRRRRPPQPNVVEIPDKYGSQSDLRVELVPGLENKHNFELNSRS